MLSYLEKRKIKFVAKSIEIHSSWYDYSLVDYIGISHRVKIICPNHGVFEQTPGNHLAGKGCKECGRLKIIAYNVKTTRDSRPDFSHITPPEGSRVVPLTQGKYALVDEEDYERVMEYNWNICNTYGNGLIGGSRVFMHRFIMDVTDPKIKIDHINHNPLDNRKVNLRTCTQKENIWNSRPNSQRKYKGISKRESGKFLAMAGIHRLGQFNTAEEAARAYDAKAKELYGEFAYLNFKD